MIKYLRLIRLPNLLMVPVTMYLLRYGIVQPILESHLSFVLEGDVTLQFSDKLFLIVALINVFLGAAGYVINDYFDIKIDTVNKSNKVLIGKGIGRRTAMVIHWVFNGVALILAAYLSYKLWKPSIFILYALIAGVFWLYSSTYKKQLLTGNIIVALGTATIPLQVAYFEIIALNKAYYQLLLTSNESFKLLFLWLCAFALFAFIVNLIREIVKDMEDFEGDSSYGRTTLPIYFGIKITKWIASALTAATIGLLAYAYYRFIGDHWSKLYLSIFVAIPLIATIVGIIFAKTTKHYKNLSSLLKAIMLMGVLYSLVAREAMIYIF